jgi:hypothetical protein
MKQVNNAANVFLMVRALCVLPTLACQHEIVKVGHVSNEFDRAQ